MSVIAVVEAAYLRLLASADLLNGFNKMGYQYGFPGARDAVEPDGAISAVGPVVPFGGFEDPVPGTLLVEPPGGVVKTPGTRLEFRAPDPVNQISLARFCFESIIAPCLAAGSYRSE